MKVLLIVFVACVFCGCATLGKRIPAQMSDAFVGNHACRDAAINLLEKSFLNPREYPINTNLKTFFFEALEKDSVESYKTTRRTFWEHYANEYLSFSLRPFGTYEKVVIKNEFPQIPIITINKGLSSQTIMKRLAQLITMSKFRSGQITKDKVPAIFKDRCLKFGNMDGETMAFLHPGIWKELSQELAFSDIVQFGPQENAYNNISAIFAILLNEYRFRRNFSENRLKWIMDSEKTLEIDRMIFFQVENDDGWLEEFIRIYRGDGIDFLLPLERHAQISVPEKNKIEIGRALSLKFNETQDKTFADIMIEIGTFIDKAYLSKGEEVGVYIHTDAIGKRAFSKYGFEDFAGPMGEDEYVMRMSGDKLKEKYGSRYPYWQKILNEKPQIKSEMPNRKDLFD
ncbi:MAG: hypothetical protein A2504_15915 [Bdellovibrionales bacterium RIFOXYD12_FULL_39_22]|nr:MAG: hypothetical protein A2385_07825 [Bdellovibrionales bacterium RIFOXYB1_FULL_39_21]OFZ43032.1 MAG: hypothetical protein A2485_11400 [Bdellovibrionales bacterium RIFOXYC12_FULL_39_17]OFZ50882.1 MAG: hypothetical protein A2404_06740 [Bdellovibrionales bacterium RIFOXYC1_FULL_39_130]OFZ78105.1 MAG: hypothetical protein A2560_01910 [Bdellovibrionales bacterium RIFOXYD1_FULL_39_84]OFZ93973.1 MAG: hypothetical protein A2504_15915 [Bdellovibrionales bacterium RIFOXYD12_FULL_39_22]HLE10422.1 hy